MSPAGTPRLLRAARRAEVIHCGTCAGAARRVACANAPACPKVVWACACKRSRTLTDELAAHGGRCRHCRRAARAPQAA